MTEKNVGRLAQGCFGAMLAFFAVVITSIGVKAVYERHLRETIRVSRGVVGPVSLSESGKRVTVLEGRDAQVAGAGLISIGLLFAVWFIGLLVHRTKPFPERPGLLSKLSALLFMTAVALRLPPWSITKSAFVAMFWLSFTVWTVAIVALIRLDKPLRGPNPIVTLFVITLLADMVGPLRSSGGAVLGLFVTILAFAHAMFVYQPWRKQIIGR